MTSANFRLLKLAREMRRMTQTDLAEASGIPQATVSRIEGSLRQPSGAELQQLADTLRFPVGFFEEPDAPAAAPLFRKRAIRSATTFRMIQARVNAAVMAARRILTAGVEIETPFSLPEPSDVPWDDPVAASEAVRRAWRLPEGRIDSVTDVIENAGGIVLHVNFGTDGTSAAFVSTLADPRPWFLVNTHERAGDRVRLSLAHELGHAVMHRYLPVYDEKALEPAAYEFGAALTLPHSQVRTQVAPDLTLSRARDLKRVFWISIQAIVTAAADRQLISKSRYRSLYKQISARGWRRVEPDPVPVEEPETWRAVIALHRERHGYSEAELAGIAQMSIEDLADLFPHDFGPRLTALPGGRAAAGSDPPPPKRPLHSI